MPVYEYLNEHTGRVVQRVTSVDERDCVPRHMKRITVPRSIVFAGARKDPEHVWQKGRKGLREIEIQMGTSETVRKVGFGRDELRKIWEV